MRVEFEPLDQLVAASGVHAIAPQTGQKVDRLKTCEVGPQRHIAGHVGDPPVQCDRVAPGIAAEQSDGAAVGAQQAEQHPDGGGLARAKYLGLTGGGGFFLYLQMHDNPTDLRAVLRDYGEEMVLPALEIYTEGLMTDSTMYDAFLEAREKGIPFTSNEGEHNDGSDSRSPAAG